MTNENQKPEQNAKTEQSTISQHDSFNNFVSKGLRIGSHIVANKSHGKTRLMFSITESLMKQDNVRNIIFDGSETWLHSFSKIPVFTIGEHDILETSRGNIQQFEKYSLQNWHLVKLCLETHKDILFRLKTRKPSKRGFFIRSIVNHLDQLQRDEKAKNPEHEISKGYSLFYRRGSKRFFEPFNLKQRNRRIFNGF